jgi:hypothetical protein
VSGTIVFDGLIVEVAGDAGVEVRPEFSQRTLASPLPHHPQSIPCREGLAQGCSQTGHIAHRNQPAGFAVSDDLGGTDCGVGHHRDPEGLGFGNGKAEILLHGGVNDEGAGGEQSGQVGVRDKAGECHPVGDPEFRGQGPEFPLVIGFLTEQGSAHDDPVDIGGGALMNDFAEGLEELVLALEPLQPGSDGDPAAVGGNTVGPGQKFPWSIAGQTVEHGAVHPRPDQAGGLAVPDEVVPGSRAIREYMIRGDRKDGAGGQSVLLNRVGGPDFGDPGKGCGDSAIEMGSESVAVEQADVPFPDEASDGGDGSGDLVDLADAMFPEDVDGDIDGFEQGGEGAGAELDDFGSEPGSVEFPEAFDHEGFGAALFTDTGDPRDATGFRAHERSGGPGSTGSAGRIGIEFGGQHALHVLEAFLVGRAELHEFAMGLEAELEGCPLVAGLGGQLEFVAGGGGHGGGALGDGEPGEDLQIGETVEDPAAGIDEGEADERISAFVLLGQRGEGSDEGAVHQQTILQVQKEIPYAFDGEATHGLIEIPGSIHGGAADDPDLRVVGCGCDEDPGRIGRHVGGTLTSARQSVKHAGVAPSTPRWRRHRWQCPPSG